MTLQEINKAYDRIVGWTDHKELKSAFDGLLGLMAGCNEPGMQDQLNALQDTYKQMLHYRLNGFQDPMQEQIYQSLLASTYELADKVKGVALAKESPLCYYSRRRIIKSQKEVSFAAIHRSLATLFDARSLHDTTVETQIEQMRHLLFNKVWVSGFLTTEEVADLQALLKSNELPSFIACQVVSALFLGLEEAFDKEKMNLLFDAATLEDIEIATRAIVAIMVILYKYRRRTARYPQLQNRLQALAESRPSLAKEMRTITLKFIMARQTEKITQKLQEEILPEMIKLNSSLAKKIKLTDLTPEKLSDEMNPEWEKMVFSNDKINRTLKEFNELQQDGADVLHSTFIHLKNYPFFRELDNWFMPFSLEYSPIGKKFDNKQQMNLVHSMAKVSKMCNSDKYSFFYSLMELPQEMCNMMLGQLDEQSVDFLMQEKESGLEEKKGFSDVAGQYIQDLYRFHKLHPSHLDFDDIFTYTLDFHNLPLLKPFLSDMESLTILAESYLQKRYFDEALTIYNQLQINNKEEVTLYQKSGYCRQLKGDWEGALQDYLHADLLFPNSRWVIRQIASCYKMLKQPEKALTYYHRYETISPDELQIQISIGHCHLAMKNYSEALKYYYKVDYLDTSTHKAWRPIAWCSFLTHKYDQARYYYKKILAEHPGLEDYLNAGHTEWALQNVPQALNFYKQAIRLEGSNWDTFYNQFEQDIPELEKAGIEKEEIPLFLDQLRYQL